MHTNPVGIERLRGALLNAQTRIMRNADLRLFASSGPVPLTRSQKDARRATALKLADKLGQLACGTEVESLEYAQLSMVIEGLTNIGLVLSGPEMLELNAAFFAARWEFAA